MPWLIPSVIATATGTAILTACYVYLYSLDRKSFLKIWAISWAVYFTRYVFLLVTLFWQQTPWLLIGYHLTCLISGVLLLYGTYLFINKKFPRIFIYLTVLGGLWIFVSILNNYSFLAISLPTFSFLAGIYVWTGIVFWQSFPTEKKEITIVAVGFILWGIHKADYPFLQPVVWFAPWGYLLSAAIELTVALGLLLVYFRRTRNEMSASETKFRSLAESSRDYIMRYDRQGRHTYMNPAALAISGLTETEIIGKTHRECGFPEELCAMWEDKIMQVFATGEPCQMEFSWKSIAGPIYLDCLLTPEHNANEKVFSVLGVSRDITERKQLESVQVFLAETSSGTERESFFYMLARFLAENLGMDFVCIDRLEGDGLSARTVAVWCDGHFEDNVSYALKDTPCGEVVGQQICCYPASVCRHFPNDRVLQELRAESYAGVTLFGHTGQPIGLIAIISRQPLGNRRLAENTLKTVAVRAAGEMERLDAEHALRASENLLRDIAASIPGALYQFVRHEDGSFAIPYMSEGGSQLLGQPFEILQDASRLFSNVYPDDIPGLWSSISESAVAMSKWRQEFRILFSTGKIKWLQATSQPNRMDDGGICWNGFILDITERKKAEDERETLQIQLKQAQKMEAIGTLAGGIAHDFNNMLGAILGYAEMIRDDLPPSSPSIHDINQVLTASHRAKGLVKQILAFSRQVEDQKIPMNPAVIVKEAIALLRSSLPTTITINQDIIADVGMVLADPIQIHQIVMNLCTNAFHAMEAKGGTLTISLCNKLLSQDDLATEPDLQSGTFVQLSVTDTGGGIVPEIRERIFDPFFTTKEVGKGTGLGLSMVYSIVKSSGGSIICDSRVGEGTEFRIILPALKGHTEQEHGSSDLTPRGKEHILLIDDEEILVELGTTMLERLGYHVTTRRSGLDALNTFHNQPDTFDLVITDQTMPGMTGVDLARRILQLRPEMPIILCTGYSSQISEETAKAAGIKGFAFKPLAKKDIGALIRKILDGKNP